jgi:hypothetical protein
MDEPSVRPVAHPKPTDRLLGWALWPAGLALALAHLLGGGLAMPLFLLLDALLVAALLLFVRSRAASGDPVAAALVLAGVGVFALASLTGAPTAQRPGDMLLNAAVLLVVAVVLLVAGALLALRAGHGAGRAPAVLGLLALAVGSTGYLANLVARWAVVLSGAAGLQAQVEGSAWTASAYLLGLPGEPSFVALLLVWFDLLQVTYLVLVYLGFAALATALGRTGHLRARTARALAATGSGLALLVTTAAVLAGALPAPVGAVAAEVAFVLTIPFMSTALPYALGVALLSGSGAERQRPSTRCNRREGGVTASRRAR